VIGCLLGFGLDILFHLNKLYVVFLSYLYFEDKLEEEKSRSVGNAVCHLSYKVVPRTKQSSEKHRQGYANTNMTPDDTMTL